MNGHKIKVQLDNNSHGWVSYKAPEGCYLRAILGKHGELRILEMEDIKDADIETKKDIERYTTIEIWHRNTWRRYTNGDTRSTVQG